MSIDVGVLGPRGQLGSALVDLGATPVIADVTHYDSLRVMLRGFRAVINCAAYTYVDAAEYNPAKAFMTNAVGPVLICQTFPGRVIHISTDYIFDGQAGPYSETARPKPINIYGLSKYAGELAIRSREDTLLIRTTVLFRSGYKNFVTNVLTGLEEHGRVQVPTAIVGTPTYVPALARRLLHLADNPGPFPLLHLAGERLMNRYDFAKEIAQVWGYDESSVVATDEVVGAAKRPLKAGLISVHVEMLGDPIEGLKEMKDADRL